MVWHFTPRSRRISLAFTAVSADLPFQLCLAWGSNGLGGPWVLASVHLDAGPACCLLTDAGWYDYAPLPAIADDMSDFISSWLKAFADTPVVVSEYGAGAISGMHHEPPIQYSEELQVLELQLLLRYRRSARVDRVARC